MKVLHISGASSCGGNEQQLIDILPAQKALGLIVRVYGVKNSPLHRKCIENSINMCWLSICKYNYRNINSIFCVSQAVKTDMINKVLKRKNHNKAVVLYEGINIDRINNNSTHINSLINKNKNSFILGNIANHVPAKDLGVLIKAIHYLVNE